MRFLRTVLSISALLAIAIYFFVGRGAHPQMLLAFEAAGAIAFVNVVLGYFALAYGIDKSNTLFMSIVFGGMGLRMAGVLVAYTLFLLNGLDVAALTLS